MASTHPDKVKEMEKAWNVHAAEFEAMALQDPPATPASKKKVKSAKDVDE